MGEEHQVRATIRQIRCDDYEELARFFNDNNRPEITSRFHPFPLTAETAHRLACTTYLDHYYITVINEQIVGLCMLRGWDEGFEVPTFGVLTDHWFNGLGLGRQMTQFAIAKATKLGCRAIRLSVYASNVRAILLYESLGFKEISRESVVVAGESDARLIMTKDLENHERIA